MVTNEPQEIANRVAENNNDIVAYIFDNSVTSMLLSTFIIGIVGVLITKLRNLKKKLDMIEILTKSHVKLKQLADEREKKLERRFIESQKEVKDSQEEVKKQISNLCQQLESKSKDLEQKIEEVKDEATKALIDYLRENSKR